MDDFVFSFFLFVSFFQFSFLVNAGRESAASPWSVWNKTDNNAWTASQVIVSPFSSDSGLALTDLYTHGPRLRFLLQRSSLGSVAATARFHSTSCRTFLPPSSSSSCSGIARSRPLHHRLRLGETFFSDKSLQTIEQELVAEFDPGFKGQRRVACKSPESSETWGGGQGKGRKANRISWERKSTCFLEATMPKLWRQEENAGLKNIDCPAPLIKHVRHSCLQDSDRSRGTTQSPKPICSQVIYTQLRRRNNSKVRKSAICFCTTESVMTLQLSS